MKDLFGNVTKGACFDESRKNRYYLFRIWDKSKPMVSFIGLNPSTANEHNNDNTITKVMKIAAHNGYGGVYMLNLYSCVTAYPDEIDSKDSKAIRINAVFIEEFTKNDVVFCWGNFKQAQEISRGVIQKFNNTLCIAQNKNGSPKHPLYCKDDSKLIPFNKQIPQWNEHN